jgi:hypothetical protein
MEPSARELTLARRGSPLAFGVMMDGAKTMAAFKAKRIARGCVQHFQIR